MNNNIEDIKILEDLKERTKEAYTCSLASGNERKDWQREVQAIENILADRERLENKANKYDSLVERMKELKKEYREIIEKNSIKAFILKCQITILQELLDTAEED